MNVELRTPQGALNDAFRKYMERRFRYSLSRFGGRIGPIVVRVANAEGSEGGDRRICSVRARIARLGTVSVKESGTDLLLVLDRALGRMERFIARRMRRVSRR